MATEQLQRISYDRQRVTAGIMHVGVGAFHRAHQAVYVDQLLDQHPEWGICGVNLRAEDRPLFDALKAQQGSYVLKTMSATGDTEFREIGSIVELIDASAHYADAVSRAADPAIRIVSMTVTESGYNLDEHDVLDLSARPIVDGLKTGIGSSIYTFLHAVVKARMDQESGAVTFLCCDNLRDNGGKLKAGLLQYLQASGDQASKDWVQTHVTFPCCMVDRITPRIDPSHALDVEARFGIKDRVTVMGESYIQWVLEDTFANGRPPLETVGVEIVDQVEPYEDAKIRVLNGGHTILTYLAALKGHRTYDAGILDPELREFFRAYETEEVIPAIGDSPIDLLAYRDIIESRFSNQYIGDTVERICMDGVSKFPIFVLPTIQGTVDRGLVPIRSIHGIASWYVFMRQAQAGRIPFHYVDPKWDWIAPMLEPGQEAVFAAEPDLWGDIPTRCPEFVNALVHEIEHLDQVFDGQTEGVVQ